MTIPVSPSPPSLTGQPGAQGATWWVPSPHTAPTPTGKRHECKSERGGSAQHRCPGPGWAVALGAHVQVLVAVRGPTPFRAPGLHIPEGMPEGWPADFPSGG